MAGYIGSKAVNLSTTGADINGDANIDGDLSFRDNDKAIFGAGSDLQIYHTGSASYIEDVGTGGLIIRSDGASITHQVSSKNSIRAVANGEVELYHNNALKMETTSTGVDITGTLTATDLILDGGTSSSVFLQDSTATNGYQLRANVSSSVDGGLLIEDLSGKNIARFDQNNDISFYEDTGSTPKFFWDASAESLGIGTSSPATSTHIVAPSGNFNTTYNDFDGVNIHLQGNGTNGSGNYGSGISWSTASGSSEKMAAISSVQTGSDANNVGLAFFTHPSNTGGDPLVEAMRIDSSGNVGIGTSSPQKELHIASSQVDLRLEDNSGTANYGEITYTDGRMIFSSDKGNSVGSSTVEFQVDNSEAMRIDASGNVGVNVSDPKAKLHISNNNTSTHTSKAAAMTLRTAEGDGMEYHLSHSNGYVGWVAATKVYAGTAGSWGDGYLEFSTAGSSGGNAVATQRLQNGYVTMPSQPHFQAKPIGGTASYNKSGSEDTLSDSMTVAGRNVGSHYNTSTGIFTAPVAGNYLFTATVRWETASFVQNSYIRLFISANNNDWNSGYAHQINGSNEAYSNYTPMSVSSVIYLAEGDNVRLKGGLHNGTSVMFRESYFTGMLIG